MRKALERATTKYQETLHQASTYLSGRGIDIASAERARLGVVASPEAGHESYTGRLCIPYIDMMGVYGLKFRCTIHASCKESGCSKYLALPGQDVSLYNITDADSVATTIHIAEGELDTIILKRVFPNDAALGIPGAAMWEEHWPFHFGGFERVLIWRDGDKAGQDLANRVRKAIRMAEVVSVPDGMDVSDLFVSAGADVMREMIGDDDGEENG